MNKVTSKFIEMKLLGNIPRAMKILQFLNISKLNVRIQEPGVTRIRSLHTDPGYEDNKHSLKYT
jgi:hypothetical protein